MLCNLMVNNRNPLRVKMISMLMKHLSRGLGLCAGSVKLSYTVSKVTQFKLRV